MEKNVLLVYNLRSGSESEGTFYTDGTYRCKGWETDDWSKWKIVDGWMWVSHYKGTYPWQICDADKARDKDLAMQLEAATAIHKMLEE